jgi:hypothetical protein
MDVPMIGIDHWTWHAARLASAARRCRRRADGDEAESENRKKFS